MLQLVSWAGHHGSTRKGIQEVWVDVACDHGVYRVTAGLVGCDLGVVVAEFPEQQSAYSFALGFKFGRVSATMHGPEWESYVREIDEWREFDTATLEDLLSRGRVEGRDTHHDRRLAPRDRENPA